ncbi:MAG: glycosyltransferase family 8 protein, partial [Bacteroidota bacterium]
VMIQKYNEILDGSNLELNMIELRDNSFSKLVTHFYFTPAAYYRIVLPEMIPEAEKILYLDSDLIIRESLKPLLDLDLGDYGLAAVENPLFDRHEDLKMPGSASYFNSGVMLLNAKKFRKEKYAETILKYVKENREKILYVDQDALNAVLHDKWISLPMKWNVQTKMYFQKPSDTMFTINEYQKGLDNPAIVHFTTKSKPWHYMNNHPFKKEYIKYLKIAGFKPEFDDYTFRNFLKKHYNIYIKRKKRIDYTYAF